MWLMITEYKILVLCVIQVQQILMSNMATPWKQSQTEISYFATDIANFLILFKILSCWLMSQCHAEDTGNDCQMTTAESCYESGDGILVCLKTIEKKNHTFYLRRLTVTNKWEGVFVLLRNTTFKMCEESQRSSQNFKRTQISSQ